MPPIILLGISGVVSSLLCITPFTVLSVLISQVCPSLFDMGLMLCFFAFTQACLTGMGKVFVLCSGCVLKVLESLWENFFTPRTASISRLNITWLLFTTTFFAVRKELIRAFLVTMEVLSTSNLPFFALATFLADCVALSYHFHTYSPT